MKTLAILPVKGNSTRTPRKNVLPVGSYSNGITEIKFEQLVKCKYVDCIFTSSDSDELLNIIKDTATKLNCTKPVYYNKRPAEYAGDCHTDKWVKYFSTQITEIPDIEDVLFVHATSPFFDEKEMESFIEEYRTNYSKTKIDSYATCDLIRNFLWKNGKPWNYDIETQGKWPLTQTLDPLYEINSAGFLFKYNDYIATGDRLPGTAGFYETNWMASLDIDYPSDFERFKTLWETYRE